MLVAGRLDATFGTKGVARIAIDANSLDTLSVLGDGKILPGGKSYARLTPAGKLDLTYAIGDVLKNFEVYEQVTPKGT